MTWHCCKRKNTPIPSKPRLLSKDKSRRHWQLFPGHQIYLPFLIQKTVQIIMRVEIVRLNFCRDVGVMYVHKFKKTTTEWTSQLERPSIAWNIFSRRFMGVSVAQNGLFCFGAFFSHWLCDTAKAVMAIFVFGNDYTSVLTSLRNLVANCKKI